PVRATSPTNPLDVERTEAEQLKIVLNDDDDDEEEISKIDEQEATESDGEDDGNGEEDQGLRISEEERMHEEEEADELYRDIDINQGRGLQVSQDIKDSHVTLTPTHSDGQQESSSTSSFVTSLLNLIIDPGMESIFTTGSSTVTPIPSPKSTMTPSIMITTTTASQSPIPPTPIPSDILQTLPTFALVFRFEDRVKSLEVNFSEFMRTNQSTEAVSNILGIVHQYMHQEMTEVKSQVKAQVTRILPRIEKSVNAQLEAKVLTRSSHSSRTSYAVAADLSEMEALVEAYDADKTILDSYGDLAILKRRREEDDDQEGPSAGSDWGSKRRREGGEHASASTPSEPATTSAGRSTTGTQSRQLSTSESAFTEEPVQTTCQIEEPSHPVFDTGAKDLPIVQTSQHPEWFSQPRRPPTPDRDWNKTLPATQGNAQSWISALAKQTDARSSFNELLDTPIDFSNFIMNRLGIDTLTLKLLDGPTYELMRGSCNSLTELEYHLEKSTKRRRISWIGTTPKFYGFAVNRESVLDVYSKRRIIAVTDLNIVEWHNYKHLDWISVRRDDDKIYKFKEGDFKRLCL
nr:hypothetical protein [Tanacetum cinerariifolium]